MIKKIVMLSLFLVLAACKEDGDTIVEGDSAIGAFPEWNAKAYVCSPFDETVDIGLGRQGILGELYYLPQSVQDKPKTLSEFFTASDAYPELNLYFDHVNVPTRPFDRGFKTRTGETLLTPEGNTLYEYFGVKLSGRFELDATQSSGHYQFALLADDGAILSFNHTGEMIELVNNDGTHPTKMACATDTLYLEKGRPYQFNLDYHQGPKYHIALMMMYRKVDDPSQIPAESVCGQSGNSLFFDSTQDPPEPTSTYNSLLDRGWKVASKENFLLPESHIYDNPCNEPEPQFTDVGLDNINQSGFAVVWSTDRMSNGYVIVTNVLSGAEEVFTLPYTDLQTTHVANVTGLSPNTLYSVTIVARSASGLETASEPFSVRTSR